MAESNVHDVRARFGATAELVAESAWYLLRKPG
jgi:hypothetical protein